MTDPASPKNVTAPAGAATDGEGPDGEGPGAPTLEFPPTLREVMLRPQWLLMLLLSLAVAGAFAWLGQWQLERAIDRDPLPSGITEEVRPIDEIVEPGEYLPEPYVGQRVDVSGSFVPGDFLVVGGRYNDGVAGYWVTGQLRVEGTADPTSLAVAFGFAETREQADEVAARLEASVDPAQTVDLRGRLISDEGPGGPPRGDDPQAMERMSPAVLLGRWHDTAALDVYRPYLTVQTLDGGGAPEGLETIYSPAPDDLSPVNWLNVFYAAEWAIFAGMAFYLWYRLAKDAWEREVEGETDDEDDDLEPGPHPAAAR